MLPWSKEAQTSGMVKDEMQQVYSSDRSVEESNKVPQEEAESPSANVDLQKQETVQLPDLEKQETVQLPDGHRWNARRAAGISGE